MIIFLDIDGVLHPDVQSGKSSKFQCLPMFENVLRKNVSAEVVISSTWREHYSLNQLKKVFAVDVASQVIDVTPTVPDRNLPVSLLAYRRHAEVETWLRGNRPVWETWIAIDDKPWLFRPFLSNLIAIPSQTGLTEEICQSIHNRLQCV